MSHTMDQTDCPFCMLSVDRIRGINEHSVWIRDGFPISRGHSLVIPKRHVASIFEATAEERNDIFALLDAAKVACDEEFKPDGYNLGINDGPAAGQTVPHVHLHLIPRYAGDRADPRGGVRWIIPEKADYWTPKGGA